MRVAGALALFSLMSLSCQTNTLGGACTVDTNCDLGQTCFLPDAQGHFSAGFCSRGCTIVGSIDECPGGSICTQDVGTASVYCTHPCMTQTDCRDGYHCNAIPGSPQKGCGN